MSLEHCLWNWSSVTKPTDWARETFFFYTWKSENRNEQHPIGDLTNPNNCYFRTLLMFIFKPGEREKGVGLLTQNFSNLTEHNFPQNLFCNQSWGLWPKPTKSEFVKERSRNLINYCPQWFSAPDTVEQHHCHWCRSWWDIFPQGDTLLQGLKDWSVTSLICPMACSPLLLSLVSPSWYPFQTFCAH